jgi:hypothetical protein
MTIRHRSASVIQRVMLDNGGRPTSSETSTLRKRLSGKGSTVVKAVTIPAWQFFRLIRMYTILAGHHSLSTNVVHSLACGQ